MADPQRPEVLNALDRLMDELDHPDGLTDEQLVAIAIRVRETKKLAEVRVAAVLASRGRSWREIGKLLGVDHTTAYGWVNPKSKTRDDA